MISLIIFTGLWVCCSLAVHNKLDQKDDPSPIWGGFFMALCCVSLWAFTGL